MVLPRVPLIPHPALQQHPGPGGHAGVGVDAAVGGRPFDVGEAQDLRVHQVAGAKVLIVAVAGGVAGERVATGVTGVFIARLFQRKTKKKYRESHWVKQQVQIIFTVVLTRRRGQFTHQAAGAKLHRSLFLHVFTQELSGFLNICLFLKLILIRNKTK